MAKIFKMLVCSFFILVLASCSAMVQDLDKLQKESDYKLENWFEESDTNEFVLDVNSVQDIRINQIDSITAQNFTGFTFVKKEVVKQNNRRAVKMLYKRNVISITYDPNGGGWKSEAELSNKTITGKYGSKVPKYPANEELIRVDYKFVGWSENFETFPSADAVVTANWSQVNAPYTIRYELQNIDNDSYTLLKEIVSGGEIGTTTSVTAENLEGFEAPLIANAAITADGAAVVYVKYNRKVFTYKFKLSDDDTIAADCKWADGSVAEVEKTGRYESEYDVSSLVPPIRGAEDSGWGFTGWNEEGGALPAKIICNKTFVAQWAKPYAKYKVITKQEDIRNPGNYNVISEETLNGSVGVTTNVSKEKIEGYVLQEITQKEILGDDSTEVEVLYNLAEVTVRFDLNNGAWENNQTVQTEFTGKYGQPVPVEYPGAPVKDMHTFKCWSPVIYKGPDGDSIRFPSKDTTYVAQWNKTKAYYGVRYYLQNIADDEYTFDETRSKTLIGDIGVDETKVEIPSIETGFEYAGIKNGPYTIAADDSTVIETKWNRKIYTVIYDPKGGTWADSSIVTKSYSGKYEAKITKPASVSKADHEFVRWSPAIPENDDEFIYTADVIYEAVWNEIGTKYKIEYFFQNVGKTDYEKRTDLLADETDKTGSVMVPVSVTPANVTGFVYKEFTIDYAKNADGTVTLKPDGSTVIKVYYDRKSNIKYTFSANGGAWSDSETVKSITGSYEETVDISSWGNPAKQFCTFAGWEPKVDQKFGADNKSFTAKWNDIPVTTISGAGIYTAQNSIKLEASVSGNNVTLKTTIPYDDTWVIEYADNGTVCKQLSSNSPEVTITNGVITFTQTFAAGHHKVTVYAKDSGGAVESAYVSFVVE